MVRRVFSVLAVAALLLCAALVTGWLALAGAAGSGGRAAVPEHAVVHAHAGPTIEQVQALAALVVLNVQVADVQVTEVRGYTGGITAALIVKGDVTLATDLSRATLESVDPAQRSAVLLLLVPQVGRPRLDHDHTRVVFVRRSGLWQLGSAERAQAAVVNRAYAEAQRRVELAGEDPKLEQQAKAHAEAVLQAFFTSMGWTLRIRWLDR